MRLSSLVLAASILFTPAAFAATAQTPPASLTCPGDQVVWVNTATGVYHYEGERWFGATKSGKFICKKDADKEGDRPTRNGQ